MLDATLPPHAVVEDGLRAVAVGVEQEAAVVVVSVDGARPGLAGAPDVLFSDRPKRDKLDGVDLDETGADPVAAALLDLRPLPQPDRQRDVAGDPVSFTFKQPVGATEALRAGAYSTALTFTLSTTSP